MRFPKLLFLSFSVRNIAFIDSQVTPESVRALKYYRQYQLCCIIEKDRMYPRIALPPRGFDKSLKILFPTEYLIFFLGNIFDHEPTLRSSENFEQNLIKNGSTFSPLKLLNWSGKNVKTER